MASLTESATAALEPIASSMHGDGYLLSVSEAPEGRLAVHISASPDACADCLVPRPILVPMIETLLTENGISADGLTVRYPNEAGT